MFCVCVYVFLLFFMNELYDNRLEKHQAYAIQLKSYKQNFCREPLEKSHDNKISIIIT